MVILALETSAAVGSVAVAREGLVVGRSFLEGQEQHAGRILGAVSRALDEAGTNLGEVQAIVVGSGPGSFTGVRIAAATAKGLAHALGLPLWTCSSLAAAAVTDAVLPANVGPEMWQKPRPEVHARALWVLFDARGDRVYAAGYRTVGVRWEQLERPQATRVGEVLSGQLPEGVTFAGEGALRHQERIVSAGFSVLDPPAGFPTADGLVHLTVGSQQAAAIVDLAQWEPEYLRASNAERERRM